MFARIIFVASTFAGASGWAAEPLHARIDALIEAKAKGEPFAAPADDAELLRRLFLDFAGRIPTIAESRTFLADTSTDKRVNLIDKLLASPHYATRMADAFHVALMERLGEHAEWSKYLHRSFANNEPWDGMVREMLRANPNATAETKGAAFFLSKRLENYGQNPVDYSGLARDIGRLFLGKDFRCAECHDHLSIDDYKQADFKGLFAFIQNASLHDAKSPAVMEKPLAGKFEFMSVFKKVPKATGPRVPGMKELAVPAFEKGEEFSIPPDAKKRTPGIPKFSALTKLAEQITSPENPAFARNIVNRLWFTLMGRGLVHPLDLDHGDNPPSHPELLDLLAGEFAAHKFDIKWLLREMALTRTYRRSSLLPAGVERVPPQSFRVALERRLSAEQLFASVVVATGTTAKADALRAKFLKAFANPVREPEDDHAPALKSALLLLNDETVQRWLTPMSGNLIERLATFNDRDAAIEIYLSTLSRVPTDRERADGAAYLGKRAGQRVVALGSLVWSLLASTEFVVNH